MQDITPQRIKTISDFHRFRGLPDPGHPLISVINTASLNVPADKKHEQLLFGFYSIALKKNPGLKFKYGQQDCDFDNGVLFFVAPGQVFGIEAGDAKAGKPPSGWLLLIHPDYLWNTPLAAMAKRYEFFDYAVNEALFLSEKEESVIADIMQQIGQEYSQGMDKFSQDIVIARLSLLLAHAERFYERQFVTRKIPNHQILKRLDDVLANCFDQGSLTLHGLPTVQFLASELNISPNYLSSLLKALTGRNAQQHIHDALIERAKQMLATTALTVNEIAYQLGFEHPQSFTRLFKLKTTVSPSMFRQGFN